MIERIRVENSFSAAFPTVKEAPLKMKNSKVKLQLFIDTSSIELFANDGEIAFTSLIIFPREIGKSLTLASNEGSISVSTLKLTELESIWNC